MPKLSKPDRTRPSPRRHLRQVVDDAIISIASPLRERVCRRDRVDERFVYREYANSTAAYTHPQAQNGREMPTSIYVGEPLTAVGAINEAAAWA